MSVKSCTPALLRAAILLVLAAGAASPARAGSGIWVYNKQVSISIINLYNDNIVLWPKGVKCMASWCNLFQDIDLVHPYRTIRQNFNWTDPMHWDGTMDITLNGRDNYSFTINFKSEKAKGVALTNYDHGTWIWLTPGPNSTGWCPIPKNPGSESFCHNRWTTPLGDGQHRSIMTLIGQKIMVSLFCSNGKDIVIVVSQHYNYEGQKDESSNYKGWKLDWNYQPASTMP